MSTDSWKIQIAALWRDAAAREDLAALQAICTFDVAIRSPSEAARLDLVCQLVTKALDEHRIRCNPDLATFLVVLDGVWPDLNSQQQRRVMHTLLEAYPDLTDSAAMALVLDYIGALFEDSERAQVLSSLATRCLGHPLAMLPQAIARLADDSTPRVLAECVALLQRIRDRDEMVARRAAESTLAQIQGKHGSD